MTDTYYTFHLSAFNYDKNPILAAQKISFQKGKWNCLVGESGSGKSTFLKCLAKLQGEIYSEEKVTSVSYMAQSDLLLPWMTVMDNVLLGSHLRGENKDYQKALSTLSSVDLEKNAIDYSYQLSKGMRQRVALARTFMENKDIILMDEPFTGLDIKIKRQLYNYAVQIFKNKTVILVTHDINEVLQLGEALFIIKNNPAVIMPVRDDKLNRLFEENSIPRIEDISKLWLQSSSFLNELYNRVYYAFFYN